ncbi:MAG: hypothetical protein QGF18_04960, partial [Alphaproteobacteria bacterium]|nr:hypothetical protein [Alphaproteobacteria bacterium]
MNTSANIQDMVKTEGRQRLCEERAAELVCAYGGLDGLDLLAPMIEKEFPGRIALSSSFGTEAAV